MSYFEKLKAGIKAGLNSSQRDHVQYRTASLLEMICSMAHNGVGMCFYMLAMRASYIGTEGYAIPVTVVGLILTVTKAFDGLTDAIAAAIFERFPAGKNGKIRVLFATGWVIEALAVLLLYSWASGKFSGIAGLILFTVTHVTYTLGYTLAVISAGTSATVLTNDPIQRPMMAFVDMAFSYGTPILMNMFLSFAILPKYDNQWNVPALREAGYIHVGFAFILMLVTCFGVRKVDVKETFETLSDDKDEKVKFRDMWNVLRHNRAAQMYIVTCATDKFAASVASEAVVTTMVAGILIGSYKATSLIGGATSIIGLICAFSGGIFIAKVGVKKATSIWSWACIALSVASIVFYVVLGKDGMSLISVAAVPTIIYLVLQMGITAAKMILSTASSAMRGDIVDYELERSGKYMPAVVYGVYSFISKLVSSLSSTISALCVALLGYTTTMPQMGDEPTTGLFWMAIFLSTVMPILGWICNIVAMKFYELDKERMVEVQRNIAQKRRRHIRWGIESRH